MGVRTASQVEHNPSNHQLSNTFSDAQSRRVGGIRWIPTDNWSTNIQVDEVVTVFMITPIPLPLYGDIQVGNSVNY